MIPDQYVKYSKVLEKKVDQLNTQITDQELSQMAFNIESIEDSDYQVLSLDLPNYDIKRLKTLSDKFVDKYPDLILLLGGRANGRGVFVVKLPELADVFEKVGNAGDISQQIGAIAGGSGGGRPCFASGGGADSLKLSQALVDVKHKIIERLR